MDEDRLASIVDALRTNRHGEYEAIPPSFRYSVSELLRPLLARAPDIGQKLGDAMRRRDMLGEGSTRVWACAFASGAPLQASQYAVSLYTGTAAD